MRFFKAILFFLVIFSTFGISLPVYADTLQPTSVSVSNFHVYRHLLQPDDFLVVADYDIEYGAIPTLNIDKTFIFRLLDTDNVTELGSFLAYPAYTGGYGQGVISFYFDNVTAPAWGLSYPIRVDENPSAFITPLFFNFSLSASNYSSATTQAQSRNEMYADIIARAQALSLVYAVALTDNSGGITVLSAYGEAYFRMAIPGIDSLCPQLFYIQVQNPDYTKRTWSYTFATLLSDTFSGTFMMTGEQGLADLFGVGRQTMWGIVTFILAIFAMWLFSMKPFQVTQPGFIDACVVILFATLLGWFSPVFHALIAFMFVMMGGLVLFINKS
jgi:hypothetical protein